MFPIIEKRKDLMDYVDNIEMRSIKSDGYEIICHGIMANFNAAHDKECRGIAFKDDKIFHRTMHKFFNVGEKEKFEDINWSDIKRIMNKDDGSMITCAFDDDILTVKSKKSFNNYVSRDAKDFIMENKNIAAFIHELKDYATPTFEWIDIKNRILVEYDRTQVVLSHVRENISGNYIDVNDLAKRYDIPVVKEYDYPMNKILDNLKTIKNFEGYVIQLKNGEMYKLKTDWYRKYHKAVAVLNEVIVARMFVDETLDDFKAELYDDVYINLVADVEEKIKKFLHEIHKQAAELSKEFIDGKSFYEKYKGNPLSDLAMRMATNREIDRELKKIIKNQLIPTLSKTKIFFGRLTDEEEIEISLNI